MNDLKVTSALFLKKSKKISADDINQINHLYPNSNWSLKEKAWHYLHGVIVPQCNMCDEKSKFLSANYWSWCSNKCMGKDPVVLEKKRITNKERYNTETPQTLDKFKMKSRQTCLDKYGVDNASKSEEIKMKSRQTCLDKYGVDNASKSEEIKEVIKTKALSRNYKNVLEKRKETNMVRYNRDHARSTHISVDDLDKLNDIDYLINQHIVLKKSCQEIANDLGISPTPILIRLAAAGITIHRYNISIVEKEIQEYVSSLTNNISLNDRTVIYPKELDIYLPGIKKAIEVNGIYWHSELAGKNKHYHVNKTIDCERNNIQLIQITDLEWAQSRDIVKSRLASLFGNNKRIGARKCSINLVDASTKKRFLSQNHIQGAIGSSVNIGLYYADDLVSIMTFGKARYNTKAEWELIRYCSLLGVNIQGGASKLFSYFIKNYKPKSVISYADRRWSIGNVYEKIGFSLLHCSPPNYHYFKEANKIESRIKFQKHKLKKHFGDKVDLHLSEWEIMKNNNYNRIWDCGNKAYIWGSLDA